MNNNCMDNSHFFDEAEQSTMVLWGLLAAFWWCTQWMIQQEHTKILKGTKSTMRFPAVAEIWWYFQHVHGFLWGSNDFGGNVMLHIEYWQSTLQSCIPWVWKSIPEMLLVGDFIIRAILRCGAPWLWSSGGWPWSAPELLCATVLWYSTGRLLHQQYYINYMYEWEFQMYSLGPTEKHTFCPA